MTSDERLERIEHVTAGLPEDRLREREDYRALWRDTQRQINEASAQIKDLGVRIGDLTVKIADTNDAVTRLADESRSADRRLGERIDALVSAIGQFIARPQS